MSGKEFQGHLLFPTLENYVSWTEDKTEVTSSGIKTHSSYLLKVGGPVARAATKTGCNACYYCYTANEDKPDA